MADREGDFYEFLHRLIVEDEAFIIRSQHNRILGEIYKKNGDKLRETLSKAPIQGSMQVEIQDANSREIKEITLLLKATQVTLPVPKKMPENATNKNGYTSITLNVAQAYNEEHEWILLTKLPIDTLD